MLEKHTFAEKHCQPCKAGDNPLTQQEAEQHLDALAPTWELTADHASIRCDFRFNNFEKTMGFVNAVAWIANREDHHPDLEVGYGHCCVTYTTHSIGGLSQNDFILAVKIDKLLE